MFKNLRTSAKLILLCAVFLISIVVTTYSLVAEKQIAIEFARKELVGTKYLTVVRSIFARVLAAPPIAAPAPRSGGRPDDLVQALMAAQSNMGAILGTGEAADDLAGALRLWSRNHDREAGLDSVRDAIGRTKQLVARIADTSNLALDPDLDSYYMQDLVARRLPIFLGQVSELQILSRQAAMRQAPSQEQKGRFEVLDGLVRSTANDVKDNLERAYRGNPDGSLKEAVDAAFTRVTSSTNAYLAALRKDFIDGQGVGRDASGANRSYGNLIEAIMGAWTAAQDELDRLLQARIAGFTRNLFLSLALIGALTGLSIIIAVMTHQYIVRPLKRLERVASTVRKTKDYSLRVDHTSGEEIGRVAVAFNDMLSELAAARERERAEQAEFMRVARLTTMGAMTASLAHEINQPLAAIVANSSAARRWLSHAQPDLDEARKALTNIANEGHRASEVIASVRSMFKRDGREKVHLSINDVIGDALSFSHDEIGKRGVVVRTELLPDLPDVVGDRVQLLQVFTNLIRNAVEAMDRVADRERLLTIRSKACTSGSVKVTVEDVGTGIAPDELERVFDAFYTTKSEGMGIGLSICRSVIEAHGGRLWASPGQSHGTIFHIVLPGA